MKTTNAIRDLEHLGIYSIHQCGYRDIAIEPTEFEHIEDLGWGDSYRAQHPARWSIWLGTEHERVMARGKEVVVEKAEAGSFDALMEAWREQQLEKPWDFRIVG